MKKSFRRANALGRLAKSKLQIAQKKVAATLAQRAVAALEWVCRSLAKAVPRRRSARAEHKLLLNNIWAAAPGSVAEQKALAAFASNFKVARWEATRGQALFEAAALGRMEAAKGLIAGGANVNGEPKRRPLMIVRSAEMGEMLLLAGANAKLVGSGWFGSGSGGSGSAASIPLHEACILGPRAWFNVLLPLSDVDQKDKEGNSPATLLVKSSHLCAEDTPPMLASLIANGANLSQRDSNGQTTLAIAVEMGLMAESLALLAAGAEFDSGASGEGMVAKALANGHCELAERLWLAGASAQGWAQGEKWNISNKNGKKIGFSVETGNTLHWAAKAGSLAIARHLLASLPVNLQEKRALLDEPTVVHGPKGARRGRAALALAAGSGSVEIIQDLLAAGAALDRESQDSVPIHIGRMGIILSQRSILAMAAMSGSVDAAKAILSAGENRQDAIDEAFLCASMIGVEMMSLFSPSSVDVKLNGAPPLSLAVDVSIRRSSTMWVETPEGKEDKARAVEAIQELVKRGFALNEPISSTSKRSLFLEAKGAPAPLLGAARAARVDLVALLLSAGANVWALDEAGCGAIDIIMDERRKQRAPAGSMEVLEMLGQAMAAQDPEKAERVFSRALARHAVDHLTSPAPANEALRLIAGRREALREARHIMSTIENGGSSETPRKSSRL